MSEVLGQSIYLLLVIVVATLTILSWIVPRFVAHWTKRYYEWVLHLLGFRVTMEPAGKGLLFWNRFAGPPVLILLLLLWRKVF